MFFPRVAPLLTALLDLLAFKITFITQPINSFIFNRFNSHLNQGGALIMSLLMVKITAITVNFVPNCRDVKIDNTLLLYLYHFIRKVNLNNR